MFANKSMVIAQAADFAKHIEHSRWSNRVWYLWVVSMLLLVLLGVALWFDKPLGTVQILAGLLGFVIFLFIVTPSAEQVSKMLAQVAAIRAGTRSEKADA